MSQEQVHFDSEPFLQQFLLKGIPQPQAQVSPPQLQVYERPALLSKCPDSCGQERCTVGRTVGSSVDRSKSIVSFRR